MPLPLAAHGVSVIEDVPLKANSDLLYSAGAAASRSDRSIDFGTSGSDSDETIYSPRKQRYRCLADKRRVEAYRALRRAGRKRFRDTSRIFAYRENVARIAMPSMDRKRQSDLLRRTGRTLTEALTTGLPDDSQLQNPSV